MRKKITPISMAALTLILFSCSCDKTAEDPMPGIEYVDAFPIDFLSTEERLAELNLETEEFFELSTEFIKETTETIKEIIETTEETTETVKETTTVEIIETETSELVIETTSIIETELIVETTFIETAEYIQEELTTEYIQEEPTYIQETKINMIYVGSYRVTFYCSCEQCCGKWAGGGTASGVWPTANHTCACGDSIPFGTILYVEGLGYYVCEDRGVPDNCIDIYVNNHSEIPSWGMAYLATYIVS